MHTHTKTAHAPEMSAYRTNTWISVRGTAVIIQILATLFALLSPVAVRAEVAGVTGIEAVAVGNKVHVKWDAPRGGDPIASYRVYYSRESILENGGMYDDFEETQGPTTEYILRTMPTGNLFVSVLAVNAAGEESPFFLEEAMVTLASSPATPTAPVVTPVPDTLEPTLPTMPLVSPSSVSTSVTPTMPQPTLPSTLPLPPIPLPTEIFSVVQAVAISATGILVTFSLPVNLAPEQALQAFTIKNASGTFLPLRRLLISGNHVEIHMVTQVRRQPYIVEVGPVVRGTSSDTTKGPLSLNAQQNKALFLGHATGLEFASSLPMMSSSQSSKASSSVPFEPAPQIPDTKKENVIKPTTNLSKSGAGAALALILTGGTMGWRRMRRGIKK